MFKRPKQDKAQTTLVPAPAQKKNANHPSSKDVARVQRIDARKPESKTAKTGLAPRLQRAEAKQPTATAKRS